MPLLKPHTVMVRAVEDDAGKDCFSLHRHCTAKLNPTLINAIESS
jgi:hypothetical protein